jgi:hypothetical protein
MLSRKQSSFAAGIARAQHSLSLNFCAVLVGAVLTLAACGDGDATKLCPSGSSGCQCFENGTCHEGLTCETGVCHHASGREGTIGGACFEDGTCNAGARCDDGTCVACSVGTEGCECTEDDTCDGSLVCRNDRCHRIPENPKCYTPCRQGFTDEGGEYRPCSENGLMEGCIGGATCEDGSCVQEGEEPPDCENDLDCPDFQSCIAERCYSECSIDEDCSGSEVCHRHTCQESCNASGGSCPDGEFCSVQDGELGACLPETPPDEDATPALAVDGAFELSAVAFELSNSAPTATITLTNSSPHPLDVELFKVEHTEYDDNGRVDVSENAMPWLELGEAGDLSLENPVPVHVPANGTIEIVVDSTSDETPLRWNGVVEVVSETLGKQRITLDYAAEPTGRWAGRVIYFTQFEDFGLDDYRMTGNVADVSNAFVQKWAAFRNKDISLDELEAVITATTTESWRWPSVRDACMERGGNYPACYLYGSGSGLREYTDDTRFEPIPTGAVELPFAMDVAFREPTDEIPAPTLSGHIVSGQALQYAAEPRITLEFEDDPKRCRSNRDECVAFLSGMSGRIVVGGRYAPDIPAQESENELVLPSCATRFKPVASPWLVPGFLRGTLPDSAADGVVKFECRDSQTPMFDPDADADDMAKRETENQALARANPIPDGATRTRDLKLVAGALVNQRTLYVIFEEHFNSFLGETDSEGFSGYGLMILQRDNEAIDDFSENEHSSEPEPVAKLEANVACSPELIEQALGTPADLEDDQHAADALATALIQGGVPPEEPAPTYDLTEVHYLCWETGRFDQGADPDNAPASCPRESQVTYFASVSLGDLSELACQEDGSCQAVLDDWQASSSVELHMNPKFRCTDENQVYCDIDLTDLRLGKTFFEQSATEPAFLPLLTEIDSAFRYKLRFQNRQGTNVGFAPSICVPDSNIIPYCYDAPTIEAISDRVDCLVHLLLEGGLSSGVRASVKSYLTKNFSTEKVRDPLLPTPVTHDGFERLYSELVNMLGDDAYTSAFKSRFDLAGIALAAFPGSRLEPNGIDLSGVAGYEMYTLYQATQYYQLVLDRFFSLSSYLWRAATGPDGTKFVTPDTVVTYFDRLLIASTHKSRAFSEIGRRYQAIGRSDLARAVVERAYTAAYLESIVFNRMMDAVQQTNPQRTDQVRQVKERAALTYRAALLDMRDVHQSFSSDLNYFGFTNDYVPLPALEPDGPNAFESLFGRAQQSASVAAEKEDIAIASNRSFDTDAQQFQGELARVRTNYENQLAELCGTFKGDDGQVYPAIRRYGPNSETTSLLGDPCGLVGNGEIHNGVAQLQLAGLDVDGIRAEFERLNGQAAAEVERVNARCDLTLALADFNYETSEEVDDLAARLQSTQRWIADLERDRSRAQHITGLLECVMAGIGTPGSCVGATLARMMFMSIDTSIQSSISAADNQMARIENEIADIRREANRFVEEAQCDAMRIDSDARVKEILLGLAELEIEALKKDIAHRVAGAEITRLHDRATRLMAEQDETEQLAINSEAARNDPNARIYKNDAILNADRTFYSALQDAYKATKVFEYYTSQSYEALTKLSLVRLVSRGDYNLEAYLAELDDAYQDFLEGLGRPDVRVDVLSLRDDILAIPRLDDNGIARSHEARVREFRGILTSPEWLNGKGYLTIPFATTLARLSPLTRNHKLSYVEAEIIGNAGDGVGRLYLSQRGTGTVAPVSGTEILYRFEPRTAILNPFFNGVRNLNGAVYPNYRLRDRPYANTSWELVLNQRDEAANQDLDLNTVSDIKLYLYYTDFTATP